MQVTAYRLRALKAPKDSLKEAIVASALKLKEGDIVAISSKVVSIGEGRCVPVGSVDKEQLVKSEADWYLKPRTSRWRRIFTIARGALVGSSGIDESNGSGHYVLFPKNPFRSARELRAWLRKTYQIQKLGVIVTDSTSLPLRRGAVGFALSWDGIDPLRDYRGTKDLFGRTIEIEMANLIDSLAAAAVLEMGEGGEQTPVAIIRNAKNIVLKNRSKEMDQLIVEPEDDLFAPILWRREWKKGGP
ncbi:MAG TPA: coenzyme F420-0:L-glutamate ligase [Candidatus Paceibacterota bacterium]